MWEVYLGVPTLKSWALAYSTKLFARFKSGSVVTKEAIMMALYVANDKWYVRVHHDWERLASILQFQIKPFFLQPYETRFFKNKFTCIYISLSKYVGQLTSENGFKGAGAMTVPLGRVSQSHFFEVNVPKDAHCCWFGPSTVL
jgi:hypothetical protein